LGSGLEVEGIRIQKLEFGAQVLDLESKVQGLHFRVQVYGSRFRDLKI
jgi:hypothetical protein